MDIQGSYSPKPVDDYSPNNPPHNNTDTLDSIELNDYNKQPVKSHEPDTDSVTGCQRVIVIVQQAIHDFWVRHGRLVKGVLLVIVSLLYATFLIYACVLDFNRARGLIYMTIVVLLYVFYAIIRDRFGEHIVKATTPCCIQMSRILQIPKVQYAVCILVCVIVLALVIYFTHTEPERLMSGVGLLVFVFLMFIFSHNPSKVDWRPVLWGLLIQFIFGVFILRTTLGYEIFEFLGVQIQIFLAYTDVGIAFAFGDIIDDYPVFILTVLTIIIFFSCCISILYHLGAMQFLILKISWLMQNTMGTSGAESLSAAGNIFVGMTEAPLLIRPYIDEMTLSELHAIMTGGFATIAGSVLALYISFGINASHLLTASVMSAPAALAFSKLFYPETKISKTKFATATEMDRGTDRNIIEAAASGAITSIPLIANITAMLVAFISLLAFINAILAWLGAMIGIDNLTFELICSYLFIPLALLMGVPMNESMKVAELIGVKTFLNEFIAYESLAKMLSAGELSERAEVISTYALCGFSNLGSIGIVLGGIGAIAPSRRSDLAGLSIRALICGSVACFSTACIAGLLYDDSLRQTAINVITNTTVASIIESTTL